MIALIAWVVIVTIALVALGIVTFRRWRRDYSFGNSGQSIAGSSTASDSEFGDGISNMGSVIAINDQNSHDTSAEASSDDGQPNCAFSYSDENLAGANVCNNSADDSAAVHQPNQSSTSTHL